MTYLLLQTFLILAAAFLFGALIACLVRNALFAKLEGASPAAEPLSPPPAERSAAPTARQPAPDPLPVNAAHTDRFGLALTGRGSAADRAGSSAVAPNSTAPQAKPAHGSAASSAPAPRESAPSPPSPHVTVTPAPGPATERRPMPAARPAAPEPARAAPPPAAGAPQASAGATEFLFGLALAGRGSAADRPGTNPAASKSGGPESRPAQVAGASSAPIPRDRAPPPPSSPAPVTSTPAQERRPAPAVQVTTAEPARAAPPPSTEVPRASSRTPRFFLFPKPAAPASAPPGSRASPPDDLTRIRGIDARTKSLLGGLGVSRFDEIACWTAPDVARVNSALGVQGRVEQENWIEQASILAKGVDTVFSRGRPAAPANPAANSASAPSAAARPEIQNVPRASAPAPAPASQPVPPSRPDLGRLRSIRSEALIGADRQGGRMAPADVDDLKRIRGIGVMVEKRLNSLAVTSYEQIANWTGIDIERVTRTLDIPGRIEREHWVEQARVLASAKEPPRRSERIDG